MKKTLTVTDEQAGKRTDVLLSEALGITRSAAERLIESTNVHIDGKSVTKSLKVSVGQSFEIEIPDPEPSEAVPEDIPLDIIYEDDDLIVINKPKGTVVHPAPGNTSGTLVNALLYHCGSTLSGVGGVIRPGIVHRIDKDTSGLLVVAKNDETHLALSEQLKTHTISRVYYAISVGNFGSETGSVNAPIGRHPTDRKKMAVIKSGKNAKEAITHYTVLEHFSGFTYIKCRLETGRTHQIRVHMSYIGHPLMGDTVYGGGKTKFEVCNKALLSGQCLHAGELEFIHPRSRALMHFEAPFPPYFLELLEKLRKL